MDEKKKDKEIQDIKDRENVSKALSITRQDFGDYFTAYEEKFGELHCPLCQNSKWAIMPRDDDKQYTAILTIPLPMVSGRGMWVYPLICAECGYVVHFAANHVASKIKG